MTTAAEASPRPTKPKALDFSELSEARGFKNMSALARGAGVSLPICSQVSRGMVPRGLVLGALARALQVTDAELLEAITRSHRRSKKAV